jgi:LruC domain-containing protein
LPDFKPTSLANNSLFGTQNDDSNPSNGRYYKTDLNLPWALHLSGPVNFRYPVEYVEILDAYLDFASWAQSSGSQSANWYTEQGLTNEGNIY